MKRLGTGTGTIIRSPRRRKRDERKREAEERRWAERNGPVTIRYVDPASLQKPAESN